jgi:hypothetical protein
MKHPNPTNSKDLGAPPEPTGVGARAPKNHAAPTATIRPMSAPTWMVVRATVNLPGGLHRDDIATVDARDPYIQRMLRATWLIPLPAIDQPAIRTNPATLEPELGKEEQDASTAR